MKINQYGYETHPQPCILRVGERGLVLGVRLLVNGHLDSEFYPYFSHRYLKCLYPSKYEALAALRGALYGT